MIGSIFGFVASVYLYHVVPSFTISLSDSKLGHFAYTFFNGKWLFDVIYNKYIITGGLQLGHIISKVMDRGVIELVGPYGLTKSLGNTANNVSSYDTGVITSYALYIILGLISIILILFAPVMLNMNSELDTSLILIYISALVLLPTSTS